MAELIQHLQEIKDFRLSFVLLCLLVVLTKFSWNHYQAILKIQREKDADEKKELRRLIETMHEVFNSNMLYKQELIKSVDELKFTVQELRRDMGKN